MHRRGLEALTRALLEHETIDGETAAHLIDEAHGEPVHPAGTRTVSALGLRRDTNEPSEVSTNGNVAPAPVPAAAPTWQPPTLPAV